MPHQITVYTAEGCMQCRLTEKALDSRNLAHTTHPADELSDELREKARGIGAAILAPLVIVHDSGGEISQAWGGYRPDLIDALAGERALAA